MDGIEAYVAELGRAVHGPRGARRELMTEARDGLVDAAAAYEERGLDAPAAARRAVEDFGSVTDVAPAFQDELAIAQARRTALLIVVLLTVQPLVWEHAWPAVAGIDAWDPGQGFVVADRVVERICTGAVVGALLALFGCGMGSRRLRPSRSLPRLTGVFALAVLGVLAVGGVLLAVLSPPGGGITGVAALLWWTVFLVAPLAAIGVSARRCLALTEATFR